ncbi:transposase, partial [Thiolapillus sp.]|uniref:IS701 family transposase n=4 Tax=Thiolapillus sp. TaxID=2017437 RepID=UPI003AF5871C
MAAKTLIRAVYRLLDGRKVRVLVDSWYMRRIFIESMLARGFDVIGQVRIDTRLYDEPPKRKKGQRGRPRKYGRKYTPKRIAHLKRSMVTLPLYGKEQEVRYRSKVLMAHFLGGRLVRVVWCEFKSESGHWKKAHLLLSTDAILTPEQIIEAYGERWSIESMFNQLKLSWGLKEAWQQTRQTL